MIKIVNRSITDVKADAIVNAANEDLMMGGGVCGAIFRAAGIEKLSKACNEIGHCDTGSAVITKGYDLSDYIIHTVGPIYKDGNHNEAELLYNCYKNSLDLLKENNLKSICFPLISAGIYGYPVVEAWSIAKKSCIDWLNNNEDKEIIFAVIDSKLYEMMNSDIEKL